MKRAALTILTILLLVRCGRTTPAPPATPALEVSFHGVWYSQAEMHRIGQGEKNVKPTETLELKTWEYTDPVGTPHPDIVQVVVRVTNPAAGAARDAYLTLQEQWKIGGAKGEDTASWGEPLPMRRFAEDARLTPGGTSTFSVPIAVGDLVRKLGSHDKYPWRLRVSIQLRDPGSKEPLAATQAELPIIPGE
jgi:hypothetical protein